MPVNPFEEISRLKSSDPKIWEKLSFLLYIWASLSIVYKCQIVYNRIFGELFSRYRSAKTCNKFNKIINYSNGYDWICIWNVTNVILHLLTHSEIILRNAGNELRTEFWVEVYVLAPFCNCQILYLSFFNKTSWNTM